MSDVGNVGNVGFSKLVGAGDVSELSLIYRMLEKEFCVNQIA